MLKKCEDYHRWGVPYCWVIDPVEETAWEFHRELSAQQCADTLHAGDISVSLSALF